METAGIRASSWVVGKVLSPLSDSLLEKWAASTKLGSNIEALKGELLKTQAILENALGREIHNQALAQMLDRMRHLAYGADDVLDELDYFRIQDELDGTYHAADVHAAGCVQDLALNARHTARACVNKLKFPMCNHADRRGEQDDGGKQGCLPGLRSCGRREISSSPRSPANQVGVHEVHAGCMPKAAHNVGKHFSSCFSLSPSTSHIAQTDIVGNPNMSVENLPLETPKLKFDRVEMSKRILEIAEQLKSECATVSGILSNYSHAPKENIAMNRPKTTPQIIEPKLYGRDVHKKIVADEFAKGEGCELTVLPIVGPGGIGKTTFTQHAYEEMKSHFEVPIWICVSLDFNVNRLAKEIVKKIPKVNNENKNCSDEELIEQRLKGKKVLLVLDDVWKHHENEWKKLIALFKKQGVKGNMVIVTTRLPEVANMVKTTEYSLELERLCPEDIMSFFEECVFGDRTPWVDHVELSDVGREIVKKLKGSPLAARTVGRLLRNTLTLNHWRSILESKEWESQTDKNDIMPALKLSYDYLPFRLQQCFSFCSLFPEDYEFGSEELVHFWIGLDILHPCDQDNRIIEHVGLCFFNDLVNYGFFKMNEKEDGRPYYTIHDLLHELAVKVSSYQCLSIYSSNARDVHIPPCVRHLSIIVDDKDVENKMSFEEYNENLRSLDKRLKVENLHTLMLYGDHHGSFAKTFGHLFKEATSFRTISLSGVSYNVENILHNFSKLVHLRYLRIKGFCYGDLRLPSTLFRLYHLEVIDLQNLRGDICSSRNMNNLIKLRHFLVPEDKFNLHSDILGVGKLKLLRELKEFRVGKESEGFELSQFGKLTDIGGSLGIYNLEKVQSKEEADELKLTQKNHIRELILEWGVEQSSKDHVKEENVLERLIPHRDLQGLHIRGHGGSSCPSWLGMNLTVKSLVSLYLDGVSWKNLPGLGEMWMVNGHGEEYQGCSISPPSFHNLKRLQLINIPLLTKWVGRGACPIFCHLEVLIIRRCPELVELPFSHPTRREAQPEEKMASFPRLQDLVIVDCPKLASVPSIPWRTGVPCSAEIVGAGSGFNRLVYSTKERSDLLLDNRGEGGEGDVLWNGLNFCNLTDLQELRMFNIPPLPLDHLQLLTSLKRIEINESRSVLPPVQSAGHGVYRFPCEDLVISDCNSSGKELTLLLSFLPNLSKLKISYCDNLIGLGVAETVSGSQRQQQTRGEEEIITAAQGLLLLPPHLEELEIFVCRNISLLSNPPHDDHANTAEEGRGGGLQRLHSFRSLDVRYCDDFLSSYSSSSSSFLPFPTSLQHLTLQNVKHMDRLHAFSNLTSLTKLHLLNLGGSTDVAGPDLEGSSEEGLWPLLAQGRLTDLSLGGLPYFFASRPDDIEEFSRSSKLLHLYTSDDTGFLAAPICSLFSSTLTRLDISFSQELERLTKEQEEALSLLTSLQVLFFSPTSALFSLAPSLDKLICLPAGLHKLINLKMLYIHLCSGIQSLPSLPSSLQMLDIFECGAIESLPNSLPSSLEILKIRGCKAIKSLPKGGLPSSMRELDVWYENSEELKRACRKLIGTIPIIRA